MKPVGHYTAPRRKITRVGENLPLVAQFRVLCRPGLLTAQHFFLFLFLFLLFLLFLLLFYSLLSPFLSSLSHFLSSLPFLPFSSPFLLSLFPFPLLLLVAPMDRSLLPHLLLRTAHVKPPYIGFKGAMYVDTWHAMCHTCMPFPCIVTHGLPCVTHMV